MASFCMPGRSSMALFTRTTKLDPEAHGARCTWAMAVHHAVRISRQRNSGYRPSRVNIMAQGRSTADHVLSLTHLSITTTRRGRTTTTLPYSTTYKPLQWTLCLSRFLCFSLRNYYLLTCTWVLLKQTWNDEEEMIICKVCILTRTMKKINNCEAVCYINIRNLINPESTWHSLV